MHNEFQESNAQLVPEHGPTDTPLGEVRGIHWGRFFGVLRDQLCSTRGPQVNCVMQGDF